MMVADRQDERWASEGKSGEIVAFGHKKSGALLHRYGIVVSKKSENKALFTGVAPALLF